MNAKVAARVSVLLLSCSVGACRSNTVTPVKPDAGAHEVMHFIEASKSEDAVVWAEKILMDADLYTSSKLTALEDETRMEWARKEIGAGFKLAAVVVHGTVVDPKEGSNCIVVHVDQVLKGNRCPEVIRVCFSTFASVVDTIFPYHVTYVRQRRYYFFLDVPNESSKKGSGVFYERVMSVPVRP